MMNGLVALLGSGEYLPVMDDVDRYLLENCAAPGRTPRVVCLPTAAGREGSASINRWSSMGVEHFTRLGAEVRALPVIDESSANEADHVSAVSEADVVYFSGGSPGYLYQTLNKSKVWEAIRTVLENGGVYAGCSAGAMILAREIPDLRAVGMRSMPGFGWIPADYILPHFDAIPIFGKPILSNLQRRLKENETILGLDEETAIVGRPEGEWMVMGQGNVHVMTKQESRKYAAGEKLILGNQS